MISPNTIRLLAGGNNDRGDLFTRLTRDLFFALGYDNLRLDVHKSGREIDLQGTHRFERRRVIGECKAHTEKMGGAELNKFFGALTRERLKSEPVQVAGYFVSLGGFTETGIEQEIESGASGVILLDAGKTVRELERCRVVVGWAEAAERAGHCAQNAGIQDVVLEEVQLLGHERGYLWSILYSRGKGLSHFALIHADGTPLAEAIAGEVVEADRRSGGTLSSLVYLAPPVASSDRVKLGAEAAAAYRRWLGEECGFIHLDGLPADSDLSATRLKLERLFVPIKVNIPPTPQEEGEVKQGAERPPLSLGEFLGLSSHIALLAMPGGGKSTLVKRLASAYAFPERRAEVADDLPDRQWLPLILRCRELRDRAHRPIVELLDDIPRHALMNPDECGVFREYAHAALRAGHALLLVDGLDEISDEGARQTFANHLRTFIAVFPQAALVVTSREAGFRLVAGVVASACDQATLAPLDEDDVLDLCERWHVEVVGDSENVRAEARDLGRAIWGNARIRVLTENPLLLTTLLVVKRWVRELPRNRAALYREAIRVLVRTWNVEGYAPLDEDETLAQLSYIACAMVEEGKQQIGQKALLRLLQNARRELEAELQFTKISPSEFIERIEYRSSLLMQTGHERSGGILEPVYEFRHLTFQEYLAARGYVEEQYSGRGFGRSLADVLQGHLLDERWLEVIPLAAVLAGRKAEDLMKRLIAACERRSRRPAGHRNERGTEDPLEILLQRCILDEVQATGPTLRAALRELACNHGNWRPQEGWVAAVLRGKFGALFQEVTEQIYLAGGPRIEEYLETLERIAVYLHFGEQRAELSDSAAASLLRALETGDRIQKIRGALVCMYVAYLHKIGTPREARHGLKVHELTSGGGKGDEQNALGSRYQLLSVRLWPMITSGDLPSALAASWALAWIAEDGLLESPPKPDQLFSLYRLWRQAQSKHEAHFSAWAFSAQPLLPRHAFTHEEWGDCDQFLLESLDDDDDGVSTYFGRVGALVVGWYRRGPWGDIELVEQISKLLEQRPSRWSNTIGALLAGLGEPGRRVLDDRERQARERQTQVNAAPR